MKKRAFTLIELLVVIAIIALLLSIILPSLRKAKEYAKRTVCMSNSRSMTLAVLLYVDEHDGLVPCASANTDQVDKCGWIKNSSSAGLSIKAQHDNIRAGTLFPYVGDVDVYRCPTANKNQMTSYDMSSQWFNYSALVDPTYGVPESTFIKKYERCRMPAKRFMFMESLTEAEWDGYWAINYTMAYWWDYPNWRHENGSVNLFADGHAEYYKLRPETVDELRASYEADPTTLSASDQSENEDFLYIYQSIWGKSFFR